MPMTENEWRARQKKHHICRECGEQDAYTLAGRTRCARCAQRDRERAMKYREGRREELRQRQAEIRRRRLEQGLCTRCGRPVHDGHRTCLSCRLETARRKRERKRAAGSLSWADRTSGRVCFFCGGEPMEGKNMCEACYKKRCEWIGVGSG